MCVYLLSVEKENAKNTHAFKFGIPPSIQPPYSTSVETPPVLWNGSGALGVPRIIFCIADAICIPFIMAY